MATETPKYTDRSVQAEWGSTDARTLRGKDWLAVSSIEVIGESGFLKTSELEVLELRRTALALSQRASKREPGCAALRSRYASELIRYDEFLLDLATCMVARRRAYEWDRGVTPEWDQAADNAWVQFVKSGGKNRPRRA